MAVSIVWAPQRTLDYLRPQPGTVPDTAILWFAATKCAQTVQPSGCLGLIDTRAGKALEVLGCSKRDEADPDTQKRQVSNQRANVWPTSWLVSPLGWQPRVCGHRSSILPVCPPFFSWVNVVGHSISESRLSSPWRLANNIQLFSLNAIEVEQVLAAFSLKTYRVFHPEATSPPTNHLSRYIRSYNLNSHCQRQCNDEFEIPTTCMDHLSHFEPDQHQRRARTRGQTQPGSGRLRITFWVFIPCAVQMSL